MGLLTLCSPSEAVMLKKPVDSVTVPGTEGTFTVTNNHSLIVSQLKAGVITVREGADSKDYFISDGYLFFNHPTDGSGCCTAEVSAVEPSRRRPWTRTARRRCSRRSWQRPKT